MEFIINNQSNLNTIIILSFQGEIEESIDQANYQWLMFYPCVYLFAMWDAYRDAGGGDKPYSFLPFVLSAYLGTVGVIFSDTVTIFGYPWGPIFFSILSLLIGVVMGLIIQKALQRSKNNI
ncbi:MAG TPA: hypothetical protein VJ824_10455 [Bacillota bacterium]|nr:hypothetical protein [Bacillota bacterium]